MQLPRSVHYARLSLGVVSEESVARESRLWLADVEAHGKNRDGGKQVFGVMRDPEWKTSQDAADRAAIAAVPSSPVWVERGGHRGREAAASFARVIQLVPDSITMILEAQELGNHGLSSEYCLYIKKSRKNKK